MRSLLTALFVICFGGFIYTSGVLEWQGGGGLPRIETKTLGYSLPVLLAFSAPVMALFAGQMAMTIVRRVGVPAVLVTSGIVICGALTMLMLRQPEIAALLARA